MGRASWPVPHFMKYTEKEDAIIAGCITPDKRFSRGLQDAISALRENGYNRDYFSVKDRFLRLAGCYRKPRQKVVSLKRASKITELENRNAFLEKRISALENINYCLTKQLASANKHRVARMLQWQEEGGIGSCR